MVNLVKSSLRDDERRFVEDIASMFAPWGMPVSAGRVYGYLLILGDAPVSVNRIAADLQMSKVGAWKSARELEAFGHIRRYGEPGSKRALYGPTDQFTAPILKQCSLLNALGTRLQNGAATVAGAAASERLQEMSQFYFSLQQAMTAVIQQFESRRMSRDR